MDQNAKHNAHCVYVTPALACGASVNYHLVWIPRYRKKVLVEPIATRLKQLFREIAAQYGFEIVADEVMPDHVHLFVSAPPKFAPAQVVRLFKGREALRGVSPRNLHKFAVLTGDRMPRSGQRATMLAPQDTSARKRFAATSKSAKRIDIPEC